MNKGWIKLHRKINENVFLSKDNSAYLVFVKLLTLANSKGEWAGGREQLGKITNLNHNTLYKVLKRLKRQHLVDINSNSRYTVYSICKWSDYQSLGNSQSNNMVTARQQHGNTITRIENKELEGELVNEKPLAPEKSFKAEYERVTKKNPSR